MTDEGNNSNNVSYIYTLVKISSHKPLGLFIGYGEYLLLSVLHNNSELAFI